MTKNFFIKGPPSNCWPDVCLVYLLRNTLWLRLRFAMKMGTFSIHFPDQSPCLQGCHDLRQVIGPNQWSIFLHLMFPLLRIQFGPNHIGVIYLQWIAHFVMGACINKCLSGFLARKCLLGKAAKNRHFLEQAGLYFTVVWLLWWHGRLKSKLNVFFSKLLTFL